MKRLIVDFNKLPPGIFALLAERYPDGYGDDDIIRFEDHHNHIIEAIELKTEEVDYLVKVNSKLHYSLINFDSKNPPIEELEGPVDLVDDEGTDRGSIFDKLGGAFMSELDEG